MFEFIFLSLFRTISGIQNGLGYARYKKARTVTSWIMMISLAGLAGWYFFQQKPNWHVLVALVCIIASIVGTEGVEDYFNDNYQILPKDAHFWELIATGGITIAWTWMGGNIFTIAASIYPALILHKAAINIIPRWKEMKWKAFAFFLDHATDDPTGETFSIPLLGWKVKRLSVKGRLLLAGVSLVGMMIVSIMHLKLTLFDLLPWIGIG